MGKMRKPYKKPALEKVKLRVSESVLTFCKTTAAVAQPTKTNKSCTAGPPPKCETTTGT